MVFTNISKGEAFKLVLCSKVAFSSNTPYSIIPMNQANLDYAGKAKISKDGGAFGSVTNDSVYITPGCFSIQLTADEMNADRIDIVYGTSDYGHEKFATQATIFTGSVSGGATAQEVWEYATRTITGGTLSSVANIAQAVWEYTSRVITGGGLSLTDTITDIESSDDISKTNPTLQEVLAFLWAVSRRPGQKRRWTEIEKFIR